MYGIEHLGRRARTQFLWLSDGTSLPLCVTIEITQRFSVHATSLIVQTTWWMDGNFGFRKPLFLYASLEFHPGGNTCAFPFINGVVRGSKYG